MFEVFSQKVPRVDVGEVFTQPSLTDQLADEPLDKLVQRFMISGGKLNFGPADFDQTKETKLEDVDAAFDDLATEDVAAMDRADQLDVLQQAREASAVLEKVQLAAQKEPRTSKGALESKAASKDSDGFKESKE